MLPDSVVGSGAGRSGDNGKYSLASSSDANGNGYLQLPDGSAFLYFGGGQWRLGHSVGYAYPDYTNSSSDPTTFPLTGWVVGVVGTAPAPVFTAGGPKTTVLTFTAGANAGASIGKRVSKTLPASATAAPSLFRARALVLSAQAVAAPVLTTARLRALLFLASATASPSLTKTVSKTLTAAASALPSLRKARALLFTASAHAQASVRRGFFRTFTARAVASAALSSPQLTVAEWLAASYTDLFTAVRTWRTAWFIHRGSPMISPAALLHYLDKIAGNVLTADYQSAANALAGDGTDANPSISRVLVGGDGVSSLVYGSGDEDFIIGMGPVTDLYVANADVFAQLALRHGTLIQKLNDTLSKMGAKVLAAGAPAFSDLDTYATYQNTLAPGSFRVLPQIALLQFVYNQRQGSRLMRPANVAPAVTHLGAGTVGAGGAVAWTPDSSVRLVNDSGAALQGYSAAKGGAVRVTQAITGTLTLTLTATGQDGTGAGASGRTWTAVLDNAAAGSVIPLVPGVGGDRIASVPTATGAGAATAGGFDVVTISER